MVELLVVISIIVILAATMLPRMRPAIEERRIREAARSVNTYISSARNRAIETGRPCGIMFQKFDNAIPGAMTVDLVEVPPPYGGDSIGAAATVQMNRSAMTFSATFSGATLTGRVSPGDLIQFNYQGPYYTITTVGGSNCTGTLDFVQAQTATPYTLPVPFKILRRPKKSHAPSLQLPAGVVLDLEASGTDTIVPSFAAAPANVPIIITFAPSGGLERIYFNNQIYPATEQVFLLVGRRDRIPAAQAADGVPNWQDLKNLWVTISPQSGAITTGNLTTYPNNTSGRPQDIVESRDLARKGLTLGGG